MTRADRSTPDRSLRLFARFVAALGFAAMGPAALASTTIVDERSTIKAPPAPELKPASVEPKTTALLVLDFVNPNCTSRPRCMASLRGMKVVLPVDGMSADNAYIEQFVAVHMTTAPLVSRNVTLTKLDLIRF